MRTPRSIEDIIEILEGLQRWDTYYGELHEKSDRGSWVSWDDLKELIIILKEEIE